MSILPSQSQSGSASASDSQSPNPNFSDHGHNLHFPPPPQQSLSRQFDSLHFSHPHPAFSGTLAPPAPDSSRSSEEVTELGTPNGTRSLSHQDEDSHSPGGRGVGSGGHSKGKTMRNTSDSPQAQQSIGSSNSSGGSVHSYGRRPQMANANHLLNFHYDPISRAPQRPPPPPRRQQKIKPYNRDLFLQANYKFVVLNTGDYSADSMDPDKMLRWEDIICVRYSTPSPVQCPICLESPLCPQITSCGHIFCFPCILRYLLMGEEDHKGDCFKRCPLCFVMVSQKDLYTIDIENVKQYSVGDHINFMLLTRQKDSYAPSQKTKLDMDIAESCNYDYDPFSKFTFTSDVELSVRKAISDLDGWLAKADSGLVDDMEKLPYVCAAMEQLENRKKYWNGQRACNNSAVYKHTNNLKGLQEYSSSTNPTSFNQTSHSSKHVTLPIDGNDRIESLDNVTGNLVGSQESHDTILSPAYDETKDVERHANGSKDVKDRDSYNFYQAVDGQHLILHPLNMKCLLHHHGSYEALPRRISGRILQLENVTQSEAMRRRYRYLSHFSLTTTFQLCEIDLSEILPQNALLPFIDEIKKREKQRKQLAKKEQKEKNKAEASDTYPLPIPGFGQFSKGDSPTFSADDFEALSSSPPVSSSHAIVGERMLFSNVTKLGYAAAHDSPSLKIEESRALHKDNANESSGGSDSGKAGTPSFANIISSRKSGENVEGPPRINEPGKKGKKQSRVLMSTASGRRY